MNRSRSKFAPIAFLGSVAALALTGCSGHEWMSSAPAGSENGSLAASDTSGTALFVQHREIQVARAKAREDAATATASASAPGVMD